MKTAPKKRHPTKTLKPDEERKFLDWTQENRSFRDYVAMLTILRTGLSNGELRGLLVSDVCTDGEIATQLRIKSEIVVTTREPREIRCPEDLRAQLETLLNWKRERGESVSPTAFLFTSTKSRQLSARQLQRIVRESSLNALGEPFTVEDLRRTFVSRPPDATSTETALPQRLPEAPLEVLAEAGEGIESAVDAHFMLDGVEKVQPKLGVWRTYDSTDGLLAGVHCLLQDRYGYLWLGTPRGVSRYDGTEFITYTTADGLAHNSVTAICEDAHGRLWFGAWHRRRVPRGVTCYDGAEFTVYTIDDGLASNYVHVIFADSRGGLWFGTDCGVTHYDGVEFVTYTIDDGLAGNSVIAICEDRDHRLWFGTESGVTCYNPPLSPSATRESKDLAKGGSEGGFTTITSDEVAGNPVFVIHEARHTHPVSLESNRSGDSGASEGIGLGANLWFGTENGAIYYDGTEFITYTTDDGLANNDVRDICEDSYGRLWFAFGFSGGGVTCFDDEVFTTYTVEDGLLDNRVSNLIADQEGLLWFAHALGGLTCFEPETLQLLTNEPVSEVLIQDAAKRLWFGSANELICLHINLINPADEQSIGNSYVRTRFNATVYSLLEDSFGRLWVGTQGDGIYCYDSINAVSTGQAQHFTTEDGLGSNAIRALLQTSDGQVWAGTEEPGYLCRYDEGRFFAIPTPHPVVLRLFEDNQQRIWMGGPAGGLSCYDGESLVTYTTTDQLPNNSVFSITEDDAGNLWIGERQGFYCFDGKEFVPSSKEHRSVKVIHQCSVKDAAGHLWFGTLMGGLYRYDGTHFQQLTTADGLPSNSITGLLPQPDGSMIIGTYRGIVHYRPTAAVPPKIEIRQVVADGVYRDIAELELTTTATRLLTIAYRGLSLATRRLRYSFILEGKDLQWRETWRNRARYENLPAGEYTFKVIAINRDVLPSAEPATLKIRVVPDPRDLVINTLQTEVDHLRREVGGKYHFKNIIGRSAGIKEVRALMTRAIDSGLNVLISGETGTGKELVAKAIHYNSPRKDRPMLDLNCGAMPKDLVASTLFGHLKGAFTGATENKKGLFESASGGTVILDEIGEMPEEAQIHLLRVLQERKVQRVGEYVSRDVDVRVIAITGRELLKEVEAGQFRRDLYYRLNEFPIFIPPLRERIDDIPLLATHFYREICDEMDRALDGFGPRVFDMLASYPWPGNVRELRNEIRRACALVEAEFPVQTYHFSDHLTRGESLIQDVLSESLSYSESLNRFRRRLVEDALQTCDGNRHQAARMLRMDRSNLVALIRRLGIEV